MSDPLLPVEKLSSSHLEPATSLHASAHQPTFLDALPAPIYTTDREGRITYFNPACVTFSGRIPELGSDEWCVTWKLYYPDGRPMPHAECPMAIALKEGRIITGAEAIAERPDGTRLWFTPYPSRLLDQNGKTVGGINMLVDITERKQMEVQRDAELAASTLLHDVSTELVRDGEMAAVFEKITHTAVVIMHADFGGLHRFDLERGAKGELGLLVCHGFAPGNDVLTEWCRAEPNCRFWSTLRKGERAIVPDVRICDLIAGTKGAPLFQEAGVGALQMTPLISRSGKLLGVLSTHWKRSYVTVEADLRLLDVLARQTADLMERSEVAAQLLQAKQEEDNASRAKDRFLAVLSHELRTPLNPVLLTASALERSPDFPETFREDIVTIRRNVELQSKLIDDLLDVSRIMAGKLTLETNRVSLNETTLRAAEICHASMRESGVHLSFDLDEKLSEVNADGVRLQQVVWNLLSNSAKFTAPGGHIYVRTENCDQGVRLTVRDTGRGIEVAKIPRVFDAFEQGEANTTREFGGLGLGLAICRAVVEQHGGIIKVASEGLGHGATFTVELPALRKMPRATPVAVEGAAAEGFLPLRILLVEDHPDTARVLTHLLSSRGHLVKAASNGHEALALLKECSFNVLLSDLGLPDMHGSALMRQIKMTHELKGIAMSGYGREEDIRRSRDAGFEEHLVKPVNFDRLEAALRRMTAAEPVQRREKIPSVDRHKKANPAAPERSIF